MLQQHKALHNEEPESGEQAIVERFIERVLSAIPPDTILSTRVQRHGIGTQMRGMLGEPDSFEAELTEDERNHLGALVEFTHPAAALTKGIAEYLKSAGIATPCVMLAVRD